MGVLDTLKHAWDVFTSQDTERARFNYQRGASYGLRPDRPRFNLGTERTMVASIYTRIGIDVASTEVHHARLDEQGRWIGNIFSGLESCLTLRANVDQGGSAFRQDIAMSLCEWGSIAIVPVETDLDPNDSSGFSIKSMRVGQIVSWFPRHVRVRLYNDTTGMFEEITISKEACAIIENPLYSVMNEPNSTLQRLTHKLNMLDAVDEASSSGKLDLIIQLPYVIKTDARRQQANERAQELQDQLKNSKYGIAYTDGSEKITQLNRPVENSLMAQIEYLTKKAYGELGLTEEVMNGTADEATMNNYFNRTVEPIIRAVSEGLTWAFLTKTARTQGQAIKYFRDPFKFVTLTALAELADKLTRNEILSSNEFRGIIGFMPHPNPKSDELVNKNLPLPVAPAVPEPISPSPAPLELEQIRE